MKLSKTASEHALCLEIWAMEQLTPLALNLDGQGQLPDVVIRGKPAS